jgi:very-short-patch-repair endonuclease
LKYQYEPYFNINDKAYFPDFVIRRIVLEVTGWNHQSQEKLKKLKKKIDLFSKEGFSVYLFIPLKHRKFYKEIDDFIISDFLTLRKFIIVPS